MRGTIKINVSGGNLNFRDIVQGQRVTIAERAAVTPADVDKEIESASKTLSDQAKISGASEEQLNQARQHLDDIKIQADSASPDIGKINDIAMAIKNTMSWAYPIIKDVVVAIWPSIDSPCGE